MTSLSPGLMVAPRQPRLRRPRELRVTCRPFLTLTDLDAKLGTRSYDIVPGVLQDANVQERIARAIPQLNKSEALLFIEPFDSGVDRGTARGRAYARRSS
jgi:hypothetical protein